MGVFHLAHEVGEAKNDSNVPVCFDRFDMKALWNQFHPHTDLRYHFRELVTPREVRNALAYVRLNAGKHGRKVATFDPCSSARWFDGWRDHDAVVDPTGDPPLTVSPRSWLLSVGWRRHGLLRVDEAPAPSR